VAIDLDHGRLSARIDALRVGFAGHRNDVLARNRAYLRAFSPDFNADLGEHDQWADDFKQKDLDHYRSSYNLTRAVVELWAALEASEYPAIRWQEAYLPVPVPTNDPQEAELRELLHTAQKTVARTVATMREQALLAHVRRSNLAFHFYKAVRRKNVYGHSWIKTVPDLNRRTFRVFSRIDPSSVYPLYAADDDDQLEAILVATRRTVVSVNAQFPGTLDVNPDGLTLNRGATYYTPTAEPIKDKDFAYVWVEDYWVVDAQWESEPSDEGEPVRSRVINVIRANQKIVQVTEYPGWTSIPYVQWQIDNERDQLGFSDVATMLPIQDSINRFMSQQQDVIAGESRPKYKYRGDADRTIVLDDESVISLDPDEDIEQIATRIDVFPTDRHSQQLLEVLARATGLPDTVWGRITAAQNSGRALATAWRAVASRMVPRVLANSMSAKRLLTMWVDWMELYDWDDAPELYAGNRDFELDFPNQEPRDFTEVSMEAIQALNAGLIDTQAAMEIRGEKSPDEMLDRVKRDYRDVDLHPEKEQARILIERLRFQTEAEKAQFEAGMQQQQAQAAAQQQQSVEQQAAASRQANIQAAQQRAPQGGPVPATQAGQVANAGTTKTGTLVQDGKAFSRIVTQEQVQ
jgi:SPP1 Gp6-like portal protein